MDASPLPAVETTARPSAPDCAGFSAAPPRPDAHAFPFGAKDAWEGAAGEWSSGLAVGDVDGDGWKDLVFAAGNDVPPGGPIMVHLNQWAASGQRTVFNRKPDQVFASHGQHMEVALGDLDADGCPELAVTVGYLLPSPLDPGLEKRARALADRILSGASELALAGFGTSEADRRRLLPDLGHVAVYSNRRAGGRCLGYRDEPWTPKLSPLDRYFAHGVTMGDLDGDGDLDLAVAAPATARDLFAGGIRGQVLIYYNDAGKLSDRPVVLGPLQGLASVAIADVDGDGLADLVVGASPPRVYRGVQASNGKIEVERAPSWTANALSGGGTAFSIDVHRQAGEALIAVSFGIPVAAGKSQKKIYAFRWPAKDPIWASDNGYNSHVKIVDIDGDRKLELVATRWYGERPSTIGRVLGWNNLFDEAMAMPDIIKSPIPRALQTADFRRRAVTTGCVRIAGDGTDRRVLHIPAANPERVLEVWRGTEKLSDLAPKSDYAVSSDSRWVSLARGLGRDDVVLLYEQSQLPDLAVATFQTNTGNFVFFNAALE